MKKNKVFWVVVFIGFFISHILAFAQDKKSEPLIKSALENVMNDVRGAIIANNYTLLTNSIDPTQRLTQEELEKISKDEKSRNFCLDQMFPDLKNSTKFIHLKIKGEWAGYYAETDLDDPDWLTVSVFVFHRIQGKWYVYAMGYGLCKARPNGKYANTPMSAWEGTDDIMNTINSDPEFQIENIIKEKEEGQKNKGEDGGDVVGDFDANMH
ncbi:MAG: hypothetical protein ABH952_06690 [Candidatus Omnitrophota bacterium]